MKLSILIVNWNSREYLRKCLTSIRHQCVELAPQIVVVDAASFDGCAEMLASDFPGVNFVQATQNLGFGGANNLGFQRVTGDALLLLNPDTEVRPGAVQALTQALEELPQAGILGARQLSADGSLQLSSIHQLPRPWNGAFTTERTHHSYWRRTGALDASAPVQVEAVSGACMMMGSETFRRVGGFDPAYFMYAEDMDLCMRVRRLGLRIYHQPRAVVLHYGGGSSSRAPSNSATVMMLESLNTYIRIHHGRTQSWLHRCLMGFSALMRLPVLAVGWQLSAPTERQRRAASIQRWWTTLCWSLGGRRTASTRVGIVNPHPSASTNREGQPVSSQA